MLFQSREEEEEATNDSELRLDEITQSAVLVLILLVQVDPQGGALLPEGMDPRNLHSGPRQSAKGRSTTPATLAANELSGTLYNWNCERQRERIHVNHACPTLVQHRGQLPLSALHLTS